MAQVGIAGRVRVEIDPAPIADFIAAAADAGDVGADGFPEAGGERRVITAGLPTFRQGRGGGRRCDFRQVPAGFDGQGFRFGDRQAGILGVQPLVPGGGGLRRRQQAEGQQRPEVLARPAGPFMIRARAMGGLALGRRDHVTRRGVRIEFPQRPGREDIRFGRAGAEAIIGAADAEGETA